MKKPLRRISLRALSLVLALSFIGQELALAVPIPAPVTLAAQAMPRTAFTLPESVAMIEDGYKAPSSKNAKTIFLVQDAHTNASGQMNYAKALARILPAEKISYIFTEAAQGDVSVSHFKKQFDPASMEPVAMNFLRKGYVKGDEYLGLSSNLDFTIWGVEDPALYDASLAAYQHVAERREKVSAYLDRVSRTAEVLKSTLYRPELKTLDAARTAYLAGEKSLTDYFEALRAAAAVSGVTLANYRHLADLQRIRGLEAKIDFKIASAEQETAVRALAPADQSELQTAAQTRHTPFRMDGSDRSADRGYYALLEEKLQNAGLTRFSELDKYFSYLKASQKLNAGQVLDELVDFETAVFGRIAATPDERLIVKFSKNLEILDRMISLKLTPDDYADFVLDSKSFDIETITGFLNLKIMGLAKHYDRSILLDAEYETAVSDAQKFYELARRRDRIFVDRMLEKMNTEGLSKAVLVTGGYHTPNLKTLLKEKGISYVSILPQVSHETDSVRYESILFKQYASIQKSSRLARSTSASRTAAMTLRLMDERRNGEVYEAFRNQLTSAVQAVRPNRVKSPLNAARMAGNSSRFKEFMRKIRSFASFLYLNVTGKSIYQLKAEVRYAEAQIRAIRFRLEDVEKEDAKNGRSGASYRQIKELKIDLDKWWRKKTHAEESIRQLGGARMAKFDRKEFALEALRAIGRDTTAGHMSSLASQINGNQGDPAYQRVADEIRDYFPKKSPDVIRSLLARLHTPEARQLMEQIAENPGLPVLKILAADLVARRIESSARMADGADASKEKDKNHPLVPANILGANLPAVSVGKIELPANLNPVILNAGKAGASQLITAILSDEKILQALVGSRHWGINPEKAQENLAAALSDALYGTPNDATIQAVRQLADVIASNQVDSSVRIVIADRLLSHRIGAPAYMEIANELIRSYDAALAENLDALLMDNASVQTRAFKWLFDRLIREAELAVQTTKIGISPDAADTARFDEHLYTAGIILRQFNHILTNKENKKWLELQLHLIIHFAQRIAQESKNEVKPFMSMLLAFYPKASRDFILAVDTIFNKVSSFLEEKSMKALLAEYGGDENVSQAMETILSFGVIAWPQDFYEFLMTRYPHGTPTMQAQYLNALKYGVVLKNETGESVTDTRRLNFILEHVLNLAKHRSTFLRKRLDEVLSYFPEEAIAYLLDGRYTPLTDRHREFFIEFILRASILGEIRGGRAQVLPMVMHEMSLEDNETIQSTILFSNYFDEPTIGLLTPEQARTVTARILEGYEKFSANDLMVKKIVGIMTRLGIAPIRQAFEYYQAHVTSNPDKAISVMLLLSQAAAGYDAKGDPDAEEIFRQILIEITEMTRSKTQEKMDNISKFYAEREKLSGYYRDSEGAKDRAKVVSVTAMAAAEKIQQLNKREAQLREQKMNASQRNGSIVSEIQAADEMLKGVKDKVAGYSIRLRLWSAVRLWWDNPDLPAEGIYALRREAKAILREKSELQAESHSNIFSLARIEKELENIEKEKEDPDRDYTMMSEAHAESKALAEGLQKKIDKSEKETIPDLKTAIESGRTRVERLHESLRLFVSSPTTTAEMAQISFRRLSEITSVQTPDIQTLTTLLDIAIDRRFGDVKGDVNIADQAAAAIKIQSDRGIYRQEVLAMVRRLTELVRQRSLVPASKEDALYQELVRQVRVRRNLPDVAKLTMRNAAHLEKETRKFRKKVDKAVGEVARVAKIMETKFRDGRVIISNVVPTMYTFLKRRFGNDSQIPELLSFVFWLMIINGDFDVETNKGPVEQATEALFHMLAGEDGKFSIQPIDQEIEKPKSSAEIIEKRYREYYFALKDLKQVVYDTRLEGYRLDEGLGWDDETNNAALSYLTAVFNSTAPLEVKSDAENAFWYLVAAPWIAQRPVNIKQKKGSNTEFLDSISADAFAVLMEIEHYLELLPQDRIINPDQINVRDAEPFAGLYNTRILVLMAYTLSNKVIQSLKSIGNTHLVDFQEILSKLSKVLPGNLAITDGQRNVSVPAVMAEAMKLLRERIAYESGEPYEEKLRLSQERLSLPRGTAPDRQRLEKKDNGDETPDKPQGSRLAAESAIQPVNIVFADGFDQKVIGIQGVRTLTMKEADKKLVEMIIRNDEEPIRVLVVRSKTKVTEETVNLLPELLWVVRGGHGTDNISPEARAILEARGGGVIATRGSAQSIGAMALRMVAAAERIHEKHEIGRADEGFYKALLSLGTFQKAFDAKTEGKASADEADHYNRIYQPISRQTLESLKGKRIGIIGYGNIGRYTAELARQLDMEVTVYSKTLKNDQKLSKKDRKITLPDGIQFATPHYMLEHAHYVITLTGIDPQDPTARHLVGEKYSKLIARNKNFRALVNPDRLDVVDEDAFFQVMHRRPDILYITDETLAADSPLRRPLMNQVLTTPHIGAQTSVAVNGVAKATSTILKGLMAEPGTAAARLSVKEERVAEILKKKEVIVLIGPPYVGKGTQGPRLMELAGPKSALLVMGDNIRAGIKAKKAAVEGAAYNDQDLEIGNLISNDEFKKMAKGEVMSDRTAVNILNLLLSRPEYAEAETLFLDGAYRTIGQVAEFADRVEIGVPGDKRPLSPGLFIILDAPKSELMKRARHRAGTETEKRVDTGKEEKRLLEYQEQTLPAVKLLRDDPRAVYVNAVKDRDGVWEEILDGILANAATGPTASRMAEITELAPERIDDKRMALDESGLETYLAGVAESANVSEGARLALSDGTVTKIIELIRNGAQVSYRHDGQENWIVLTDRQGNETKIWEEAADDMRLSAAQLLELDMAHIEALLKAIKELRLPIRPVNYRLNVTQLISGLDAENQSAIIQKLKDVLELAHKKGFGSFIYSDEDAGLNLPVFDLVKGAPTTALRDLKSLEKFRGDGLGLFYDQGKNEFIPLLSTLLAQNFLAHALQISDPVAQAHALQAIEPVLQALTGSNENIVGKKMLFEQVPQNAQKDVLEKIAVKGLTLRGYLDLIVYLQNLSRQQIESAA